ncbi:MAG: YfiR family protein [Cyclobacteriaceae bacterium]
MKYIIITIIGLSLSISSFGQESKYKALFIYKFMQNIEWPADKVASQYTVAVLGDSEVLDQLTTLTSGRKINGKSISVVSYSGSISGVNLLFLSRNNEDQFDSINKEAISNAVVLVTESKGFAKKGATINFNNEGGKLKFEMNPATLSASGLTASGSIKSLAVLVN